MYHGIDAIQHAGDVLESAQSVFLGLRSDAVSEVIKSARESQAQALDTVRQSVKAAQDLVKNSTERVLASLVSVGAVVIANAAKSLSDETSRGLLLFVAAFLCLLALFALVIEGPLLASPLDTLDEDLRRGSRVVFDTQLQSVVSMPSVETTKRRVCFLRFVISSVYLVLAILIILFGFPSQYR